MVNKTTIKDYVLTDIKLTNALLSESNNITYYNFLNTNIIIHTYGTKMLEIEGDKIILERKLKKYIQLW